MTTEEEGFVRVVDPEIQPESAYLPDAKQIKTLPREECPARECVRAFGKNSPVVSPAKVRDVIRDACQCGKLEMAVSCGELFSRFSALRK